MTVQLSLTPAPARQGSPGHPPTPFMITCFGNSSFWEDCGLSFVIPLGGGSVTPWALEFVKYNPCNH